MEREALNTLFSAMTAIVVTAVLAVSMTAMPSMALADESGASQGVAQVSSKAADAKAKPAAKVKITKAKVAKIGKKIYTGKHIKPAVTVKYQGKKLVEGKDFRVSYKKNKRAGTARVVLKGIGGFTGKKTVTFKIQKKPRIAIVNTSNESHGQLARWLRKSGFDVTWVSSVSKLSTKKYDALAIPGGGDVTPSLYGDSKRHSLTYGCNLSRDKLQIKAIKKFAKAGKPIIGICRGCQILNVAFGGTLHQHISWHRGYRTVKIKKDSWLYGKYGSSEYVKHSHHQCVKKVGAGLVATQWDASTGNIEAIEHKTKPIYGLQWHPDLMGDKGVSVGKKFLKVVCKEANNA